MQSRLLTLTLLPLLAASACASTTPRGAGTSQARGADDMDTFTDAELPNGVLESCGVAERNVEAGGSRLLRVAGGEGRFTVLLPEAPDWKMQCDGRRLFWALSRSARLQVTVNPREGGPLT